MLQLNKLFFATLLITGITFANSNQLSTLKNATYVEPVAANKKISFNVWFKLKNKEQLDAYTNDLYNPDSPVYQRYLTAEEFKQYQLNAKEEQLLQNYFNSLGMKAKLLNHHLQVTATAAQIEKEFKLKINYYKIKNKLVYSNNKAPKLSVLLQQYVESVSGLSNIERFRPYAITLSKHMPKTAENQPEAGQPTTNSMNGFSGAEIRT